MKNYEVIRLASNLSVIVPILIYLARIGNAGTRIHTIAVMLAVSGTADLITFFTKDFTIIPAVINSYYILQFWVVTAFFYKIKIERPFIVGGIMIYSAVIFASLVVVGMSYYQTMAWTMSSLIIILYSTSYKFNLNNGVIPRDENTLSTMWIIAGLQFYFTFDIFLFATSDYILYHLPLDDKRFYWSIHNVNNIIKNIMIAIGIFYSKGTSKHQSTPG